MFPDYRLLGDAVERCLGSECGGLAGAPSSGGDSAGSAATPTGGGTTGGSSVSTGGNTVAGSMAVGEGGTPDSDAGAGGSNAGLGGADEAGGTGGTGGGGGSAGSAGGPSVQVLSVGRPSAASTQENGHTAGHGNDDDPQTRWCAQNGDLPQWWRVDLEGTHDVREVSIQVEHPERVYFFSIETSSNDMAYTERLRGSATGDPQTFELPAGTSARYVRVTVTDVEPAVLNGNGTWASFFEVVVRGN